MDELETLAEFARDIAIGAGRVVMPFFRGKYEMEIKADASPVTEADRLAEKYLRRRITERYPDHAILGEEYGEEEAGDTHRWIVDPIDGTVSFISGVPLFATLVALEVAGEPVLGVAHFPALGETVWAAKGKGCQFGTAPARVRPCAALREAIVCASGMHGTDIVFPDGPRPGHPRARMGVLLPEVRAFRGWGDAYGHILVATGRADAMVDPVMSPWDIAALVPIIEEAGGTVTTLSGTREDLVNGGSLVSSAGTIHAQIIRLLAEGEAQS